MKNCLKILIISILILILVDSGSTKKNRRKNNSNKVVEQEKAANSDCFFDIPRDIPKNEPVYLRKIENGVNQILRPFEPRQRFKKDDEITLFCPTKNNKFTSGIVKIFDLLLKEFRQKNILIL